jgi:membrane protease YdiL (CAAX protease family)
VRSLGFLGLALGVLAVTALASPWVAWALAAAVGRPFTFGRVYDRVFEILLLAGVVAGWRALDLGGAADIGFRRRGWRRDLWCGLAAGAAGLAVGLGLCALAGALVPDLRFPPGKTVRKALLGAGAAAAIGVGEEALFRGVLLRRLRHDVGPVLGVLATTLIYAAVHGIRGGGRIAHVDAWSGVAYTQRLLAPLADGAALPQLAGLVLLGLLLARARLASGALWLPVGIHAAFVATFRVGRLFFEIRPTPPWLVGPGWPPLIGGVAGWAAVAVAAALLRFARPKRAPLSPRSNAC